MDGYDLRGVEDQDSTCACGGIVKHWTIERITEILLFPVRRSIRVRTACLGCKQRSDKRASRERAVEFGLTTGIQLRVVTSYFVYAAMMAVLVVGAWRMYFSTDERVAEPEVGDLWTIRTAQWPSNVFSTTFKYGAVHIDEIEGDEIFVSACGMVTNSQFSTRRRCNSERVPIVGMNRADAIALARRDGIADVSRKGDYARMAAFIGGALLLFGGWVALNAPLRRRRYRFAIA